MLGIVLLAGGNGNRFGGKKQDYLFHNIPLWEYSYKQAKRITDNLIVVGKDTKAGKTRSESVRIGLNELNNKTTKVIIMEAARPLVTLEQLKILSYDDSLSASFVNSLINTVIGKDGSYYDRNKMYELLVPQSFDYKMLKDAYDTGKYYDMTDETRVMYEEYGIQAHLIETGRNLYKVTYPGDLEILEIIYNRMGALK